jgi:hypothetical protein
MNVEIGTETPIFLFWEYWFGGKDTGTEDTISQFG